MQDIRMSCCAMQCCTQYAYNCWTIMLYYQKSKELVAVRLLRTVRGKTETFRPTKKDE